MKVKPMYGTSSSNIHDFAGAIREKKKREEEAYQRAEIERQYQAQMAQDNKRGTLDRVFDVLSTPGFMVNGFIQDGLSGIGDGFKAGMDGFAFGDKEYGKEYAFEDSLGKATGGKWSNWQPESFLGKTGKFAVNLAGEIATDPTSYLTGASVLKSLGKGTGKRLGKETVEMVTEEAIKKAGRNANKEVTEQTARRYAEKANKILGNKTSVGDVKFAGMELKGSGDFLRNLGDKTIAPVFNSLGDGLRFSKASKLVDTASPIRQTMKGGNLEGFVKEMKFKDGVTQLRREKMANIMKFGGDAKKVFKNIDDDARKQMTNIMENRDSYEEVVVPLNANEEQKRFFSEFMDYYMAGKTADDMGKVSANKVLDELKQSNNFIDVMKNPKDDYTQYVYKKMIEDNLGTKFDTYEQAYTGFMNKLNISHKEIPQAKPKIKTRADIEIAKNYGDTPLTDLDRQTGLFVNTNNLKKYQTLFSNNKAMTTLVGLNPKRKIEYLNNVLFDGKPFIGMPTDKRLQAKLEGKLNGVFKLIKDGADESQIFNALDGMIDLNNIDKTFLNTDIYLSTQEIMDITPEALSQLDLSSTQRIYNAETRELVYADKGGVMTKRNNPVAEDLRIAKQAKLQQIEEVTTGAKTLAQTNVSEVLTAQREEVAVALEKDLTDIWAKYDVQTSNPALTDDLIFVEETMMLDGKPAFINSSDDFRDLEFGEIDSTFIQNSQKAMEDLAEGKIGTPEVVSTMSDIDKLKPPSQSIDEMYVTTIVDETTGQSYKAIYDPYTRETKQQAMQVKFLDDWQARMSPTPNQLERFLETNATDDNLTKLFHNYMEAKRLPGEEALPNYIVQNGELFIGRIDMILKSSDVALSRDMKNAMDYVTKEFEKMGMGERRAGKLKNLLNNYVPHIMNPEILKNPRIAEALKKEDPDLYRTVFMHAGDKFNKHGVQRSDLLERKVKEILTDKHAQQGMTYQGSGKTIAEVNEALKPMLERAGFDGDFFLTDMYDIFTARAKTHGEVVYSDKFIDDTLQEFGKFVKPEMVQDGRKYYINQKNIRDVFEGLDDKTQLIMMQEMGIDFDRTYNKMMVEISGEKLEKFYKASEKYGNTMITAWELPDYIVQMANQNGYTDMLDDTKGFLKVYDKFTNLWKQSATVINPGFHIRNKFSNTFQNFLAIGTDVFNTEKRNAVKGILAGADGELITDAGKTITFQEIRDELVTRDILSFQDFDLEKRQIKAHTLFGDELGNVGKGGLAEAIGRKLGAEDPTMFNKIDPTDSANFWGYTKGRKIGANIEDFDRTLNFVSNALRDVDYDTAQDMVNHFLFDYSDLTGFETKVMKRLIPFYTWLRKNAPLQMEQLIEKPWLYAGVADLHRESTRDKDTSGLPEYMRDWIGLPIKWTFGDTEKDMYMNLSMPYQDLGKNLLDPKEVFGMMNPFIKLPVEFATNHNTFFDSPIASDIEELPSAYAKHGANTLLGAWNTLGKGIGALASGDLEQIMTSTGSLATGVKVKTHDTEKAKEDAIYRAIRAMEEQLESQKTSKSGFNKTFDEYKKTKLEKYGY